MLETRRRLMGEFTRQAQRDTFKFRSRERFMANRGSTALDVGVNERRLPTSPQAQLPSQGDADVDNGWRLRMRS
jgi:hypothetical protein